MAPFMLVSVIVTSFLCYVEGQSKCSTLSGSSGSCISLYDCQPLLAILNNKNKTPKDMEDIRKASCGFSGQTPLVCCPSDNPCFTPDAKQGSCVGVHSCPHIAKLLNTPPVSKETITFIQNSRCTGPDQYSVCCGPEVNTPKPGKKGVCVPSAAPPDPKSKCCGVDSVSGDKLYGSEATAVDQYPWLVIIEYFKRGNNKIKLLCGGVLISGRYVLTAGHCVVGPVLDSGTPTNVRLGEYDTDNDVNAADCTETAGGGEDCTQGVKVIRIEKAIPHPQYNPNHRLKRHDIALLRLAELAPYTDFIRPICLPTTDLTLTPPQNFLLYAAGWGAVNDTHGRTNIKQHVGLPFVAMQECQPSYSIPSRNLDLWTGQLCAGGEKGKDSCKGDSGGPLMYENDRHFDVIGLVSFGPTPCGMENVPGVYTKVYEYDAWIRSEIKP